MSGASGEFGRVGLAEAFGLKPLGAGLRQALTAIRGSRYQPPNLWGPTSLRIFKPRIGLKTWLGVRPADGRTPIYNYFNRVRPPRDRGYSVRLTYARDYRGGRWTYDGHNGTDFAVPVGTPVVAAAPGVVLRVKNDFHQGGLKVCIDHGRGQFTTSGHMARAFVSVGEPVGRGQVVGLSGASGMEFVLFFPWVAPHVHFNTWVNGDPSDPYAADREVSLWRRHNDPVPWDGEDPGDPDVFEPSSYDERGVADAIAAGKNPVMRSEMAAMPVLAERAAEVMFQRSYRPALFQEFPRIYAEEYAREALLDLPFRASDFVGARPA